jgi:hypothetical protein
MLLMTQLEMQIVSNGLKEVNGARQVLQLEVTRLTEANGILTQLANKYRNQQLSRPEVMLVLEELLQHERIA